MLLSTFQKIAPTVRFLVSLTPRRPRLPEPARAEPRGSSKAPRAALARGSRLRLSQGMSIPVPKAMANGASTRRIFPALALALACALARSWLLTMPGGVGGGGGGGGCMGGVPYLTPPYPLDGSGCVHEPSPELGELQEAAAGKLAVILAQDPAQRLATCVRHAEGLLLGAETGELCQLEMQCLLLIRWLPYSTPVIPLWPLPPSPPVAPPLRNGSLFVPDRDGNVHRLDPVADGARPLRTRPARSLRTRPARPL
jgi:hypothetical protein